MFERIESLFKKIDVLFEWLTVLTLGGMTLAIFTQVIFRYVLSAPLAWTEELSIFMFIWMTFIAGYVAARKGKHIGVDALRERLPSFCRKGLECLSNLICTVFFSIIVFSTVSFWPKLMRQTSPALELPMAYVYLIMIVASFFMALWYAVLAVVSITGKKPARTAGSEGDCGS